MANPAATDATSLPLYVVYQPVLRMNEDGPVVFAYESLMRVGPTEADHSTLSVITLAEQNGTMPKLDTIRAIMVSSLGMVPFCSVITLAEQNGTMPKLDTMIARMVCSDVASIDGMRLWINLSQSTMATPAAAKEIGELIEAHNLSSRVTLEITETVSGNEQRIVESLRWLKSKNITVVLDDIDDGFAKSHLLQSEFIAGCKLSRRSTIRMTREPDYLASARKLATWCKANGKSVVMEGIETMQEFECAVNLGADFCQGFYFWKPILLSQLPAPGTRVLMPPPLPETMALAR